MISQSSIKHSLENLSNEKQIKLLLSYGHQLTVMARDAYEFQGPGVTKPRLLRDVNEINHRLYPQIQMLLLEGKSVFPLEELASWIAGEGRPAVQKASIEAFERARCLCNT
jgi:hypothetical protein